MKKTLAILALTTAFVSANANAKDGFYLGADALYSYATNSYQTLTPHRSRRLEGKQTDDESLGFGLSAGYKVSVNKLFFAPELFYDYIDNKSPDFFYEQASESNDILKIKDRFGGKLNIGYNITKNFSAFVNAGVTSVQYGVFWYTPQQSRVARKVAPIYGVGLMYNLNDHLAVRASYDYQDFNIQYVQEGRRSNVRLDVYKVGLVYGF